MYGCGVDMYYVIVYCVQVCGEIWCCFDLVVDYMFLDVFYVFGQLFDYLIGYLFFVCVLVFVWGDWYYWWIDVEYVLVWW